MPESWPISGPLDAEIGPLPPDLEEVIAAWKHLDDDERKAVAEIVRRAAARAEENDGR